MLSFFVRALAGDSRQRDGDPVSTGVDVLVDASAVSAGTVEDGDGVVERVDAVVDSACPVDDLPGSGKYDGNSKRYVGSSLGD